MYPCEPGSGGAADHGRLDLSGYRYTGMGPGRPGAGPVVGRYTLMASSIPISLPINSGRRAPVLEHSRYASSLCESFFALRSGMKTAPEAYHLCAERGASLCKAPSWVLVLQSTVSPPTLESAPLTRDCLAFLFRYALRPCAPSASSGHRDPTSRHSSLRFRVW
jgi:hypothetical protein